LSIIDIGFNFVPCQHLDISSYFYYLVKNFDTSLKKFNNRIFFDKQKINHNKNSSAESNFTNSDLNSFSFSTEIDSCTDFSCVFKKMKTKSFNNIPFQKESLEFRFHFIRELSKNKVINQVNLSKNQFSALKYFIKHRPFRVLEADKNIGAVILSETVENQLADEALSDTFTYTRLLSDPLEFTQNLICDKLEYLFNNGHISKRCKNLLKVDNPRCGIFRILPKLHKSKFGIRPIINCINSPMSNICLFFFLILQPFIVLTESYLQDSQHLLQLIAEMDFTIFDHIYLHSCDFDSLYTNIERDIAVNLVLEFIVQKNAIDIDHINIVGIKELLILVFDNNIFCWKKNFYRQCRGLAMGAICGPAIANVVVYKLEKKWLYIHKPLIYRRYIDDICILDNKLLNLSNFKSVFGSLKLNIVSGLEIQFLDIKITYDPLFRHLITSLFIKPTNTFSYLSIFSNHKPSIFKNIPISLLIRVRRICSETYDFFYFARLLISQLIQRGYSYSYLLTIIRNIFELNREDILPYKKKNDLSKLDNNSIFFVIPFNRSNIQVNKLIYNSFNSLKEVYDLGDLKLKVVNSVNNSLKKILVHNGNLSQFNYRFECSPCLLDNCRSCPFFQTKIIVDFDNKFSLPILSNSNCKSKFCIYILHCIYCNSYYIGETIQTFEKRLDAHRSNIRCFSPFEKEYSEMALHFNKKGHNFLIHLKAYIFACEITDDVTRLDIESELIHLFLLFGCKVINARLLRHIERFCSGLT
jgi:hypothetical protein